MRKIILLVLVLIALFAIVGSVAAADAGRQFTTTLTGAAEVPGPGDPDGIGTAQITLNQGQNEVCWAITVENITLPASAAHIHVIDPLLGFGSVVVTLSAPDASGSSSGCTTADPQLIKAIRQNPQSYYVNVHTSDYPGGAVRGDLSK